MSFETWKSNYLRVAMSRLVSSHDAVIGEAIRLKWLGARPDNLLVHGLHRSGSDIRDRNCNIVYSFDASTCPWCLITEKDQRSCDACPAVLAGSKPCTDGPRPSTESPYKMFTEYGDVEPMLKWIDEANVNIAAGVKASVGNKKECEMPDMSMIRAMDKEIERLRDAFGMVRTIVNSDRGDDPRGVKRMSGVLSLCTRALEDLVSRDSAETPSATEACESKRLKDALALIAGGLPSHEFIGTNSRLNLFRNIAKAAVRGYKVYVGDNNRLMMRRPALDEEISRDHVMNFEEK